MKYRKRPVIIDAWRYHDDLQLEAICDRSDTPAGRVPHIHTLEGPLMIAQGDWIIRGIAGEFYPCKDEIFRATYEPVEDAPSAV